MRRTLASLTLASVSLSVPASAESGAPGSATALASATPPTAASGAAPAAAAAAPPSTAPAAEEQPAAAPAQEAPANPHANAGPSAPADENAPATDLPPGTIEAVIVDPNGTPLSGVQVRLGIMFQKISEGESRSERFAMTDANGRARFDHLERASEYSYRVTLKREQAEYGSSPFPLDSKVGQRVKLHIYPVTTQLGSAPIGMRGFVYVEPRDDVFQFEMLFRVVNVGAVTWVPNDVILKLPSGFKAFSAQKGMSDVGFDFAEGVGARLKGTFSPGQHDVGFRFQVPKGGDPQASFEFALLPRVFEMRVIVEASASTKLAVASGTNQFPAAEAEANQQGKRVLVTGARFTPANEPVPISVQLTGLPVPGPGRWVAVFIASLLGGLGLAAFRGVVRLDSGVKGRANQDLESARELLLNELVDVEKAHRNGELGPRAYADARRTLLEALSRLGRDVLQSPKKKKRAVAA